MKGPKSFPLVVALSLALAMPVNAAAPWSEETKPASLQEKLRQAMPETPDNSVAHYVHYGLELVEAVEFGLVYFNAVHAAGLLGLGIEIAAPVAGMAAVFIAIGSAHAEAINSNISHQMYSGFSRGVVLGADHRSVEYLKEHWVKWSPVSNAVYPEYGRKFQQAYNTALMAGYAQGKALTDEERKAFFKDLIARLPENPTVTYGENSKEWSDRSWRDYYTETAAVFRRDHLK